MSRHTPGPWRVDDFDSGVRTDYEPKEKRVHGYDVGNSFVADLNDGEYHEYCDAAEQAANARLIAAAPELLEVAKNSLSRYPEQNLLRDAVEKAEGSA